MVSKGANRRSALSRRSAPTNVQSLSRIVFTVTFIRSLGTSRNNIDERSAQEWTNRTVISHEPLICSEMCFTKTELVQ